MKMQLDKKNLPNFAIVEPGILRGAAPTAEGLKKLKEQGVKTIIDLRIEKKGQAEEEAAVKALGLNRVRIPMGAEAPTQKQVAQFLALLKKAKGEPVFVHCQHGADRTGAMVGIWRVTHNNWGFSQTYAEMRKFGFKPWLKDLKGAVEKRATKK
jgi:tyrosine-protein phosphatase SIW14